MAIAKGVSKLVAYKRESSWGTPAGATGGKLLRRVTADFNLTKETYESNEINPSFQTIDSRHGVRSVEGSLEAELSPGTYSDFIGSILAKDFVAGGTVSGASITIAASGEFYTITRAAGSWLTDGFYVGNIIRLSGAGFNAANVDNNLLIVGLTALVATVVLLSDTPLVAEGPIASAGASVVGKHSYVPLTGHTDQSYTVEQYFADIAQSEVYTGLKPASIALSLPSTGLVTASLSFMGKNLEQTGTSQYFTSPAATNTEGIFAAVSGAVIVNGAPVGLITSMDLNISRNQEAANVVGSNSAADIFVGRITATGSLSVYFQDANFRNFFDDEAKISLVVALTTGEEKDAEAMSFAMGKVKVNSASKTDAELGLTQSMDFQALQNDVTSGGLVASTILVQDTTLV
jgi:hypothetical protein